MLNKLNSNRKHIVYLALGTNLGDRLANLKIARAALSPSVRIEACSPIYETPPWGYLEQGSFLNQVIQGTTKLTPKKLITHLKQLEIDLGRIRNFINGPRSIDIDILFYDDLVLETPDITIPHPRMEGRAFVWLPLADIAPDFCHPITRKKVKDVLAEIDTRGIVHYANGCLD